MGITIGYGDEDDDNGVLPRNSEEEPELDVLARLTEIMMHPPRSVVGGTYCWTDEDERRRLLEETEGGDDGCYSGDDDGDGGDSTLDEGDDVVMMSSNRVDRSSSSSSHTTHRALPSLPLTLTTRYPTVRSARLSIQSLGGEGGRKKEGVCIPVIGEGGGGRGVNTLRLHRLAL